MDRIGIIGFFADTHGGQEILTKTIKEELEQRLPEKRMFCVDTAAYHKNKLNIFALLIKSVYCVAGCKDIFVLLSRNGLKVYLPLLYYMNKLFRHNIYHRIIGGNICEIIENNPKMVKYMNAFSVNWAEGAKQTENLQKLGVKNAEEIYNFKSVQIADAADMVEYSKPPYKFCTFCRITKSKGIGLAIDAVKKLNDVHGENTALLDVYGMLQDDYKDEFLQKLDEAKGAARYMGSVAPNDSVKTLVPYFVHLFPTTWQGEGMPGTVVDAVTAGLPTIASDWHLNPEYVIEGVTGYCYPWNQPEQLYELMETAVLNPKKIFDMRGNCLYEARKYTPDAVMAQMIEKMAKENKK